MFWNWGRGQRIILSKEGDNYVACYKPHLGDGGGILCILPYTEDRAPTRDELAQQLSNVFRTDPSRLTVEVRPSFLMGLRTGMESVRQTLYAIADQREYNRNKLQFKALKR